MDLFASHDFRMLMFPLSVESHHKIVVGMLKLKMYVPARKVSPESQLTLQYFGLYLT